mmetsp:Transcript_29744/g.72026  ORF Transcript_29744/g.72026 Transcript_29744/m.72026 type:complete len:378 (+) Transcript_29744:614-1747(+)
MDVKDDGPFSSLSTIADSLPPVVATATKVVEAGEGAGAGAGSGSGAGSGAEAEGTTSMSSTQPSSLSPSTSSCSDNSQSEQKQHPLEEEEEEHEDAEVCDDQPRRTVSPPPPSSDTSIEDKLSCPPEPSSSDPMTANIETATDTNNKQHNLDGSSAVSGAVAGVGVGASSSSSSKPTGGGSSSMTNLKKRNFLDKPSSFASSSSSLVTSKNANTNTTNTKHQRRTTAGTTTNARKRRHRVSFTTVQIRRYPMLLGDNPAVLSGPPVSLGWEYEVLPEMPLVDFETFRLRSRRLHSNHLLLSHYKRLEIIQRNGHTAEEVKAVEKQIAKIKRQRNMSLAMTPLTPLQNIAESAGRKIKRSFSIGGGSGGRRRREEKNA